MEPVDPNEAPDYYKVIKEPMGEFQIYNQITKKKLLICFYHLISENTFLIPKTLS